MQLIRGLINLNRLSQSCLATTGNGCVATTGNGCVATIGNFDGVHLGHRMVVKRVIEQAKSRQLPSCVILFEPHPKEFFSAGQAPSRLTSFREKYLLLRQLGIDYLVVLQFNRKLSQLSAEDFVQQVLVEKLNLAHLVVGDDFHFGHKRLGNFQLLERMSPGKYTLEPTSSVILKKLRVSSTLIREKLAANDLKQAEKMLGRPFSVKGKIGYGQQLGRKLGFPTANVAIKNRKMPVQGVFLVKCAWRANGQVNIAWGAANVGARPTVDGYQNKLEVHLLDVNENLYGVELTVEFIQFIREEIKFAGLPALKSQIGKDVQKVQQLITEFASTETN